uniref:Uncharacterized protein n=1 Tax=Glossina palpalis gambiensis TaxID=67801 RepID=A0A1B0C3K5_9MUSC
MDWPNNRYPRLTLAKQNEYILVYTINITMCINICWITCYKATSPPNRRHNDLFMLPAIMSLVVTRTPEIFVEAIMRCISSKFPNFDLNKCSIFKFNTTLISRSIASFKTTVPSEYFETIFSKSIRSVVTLLKEFILPRTRAMPTLSAALTFLLSLPISSTSLLSIFGRLKTTVAVSLSSLNAIKVKLAPFCLSSSCGYNAPSSDIFIYREHLRLITNTNSKLKINDKCLVLGDYSPPSCNYNLLFVT